MSDVSTNENANKAIKAIEVGSITHLENGGSGLVFSVKLFKNASPVNAGVGNAEHLSEPESASSSSLSPSVPPLIPAFAVKYQDQIYVYKNVCGHIAINLDFREGQFFDEEGENLICSTHGAAYQANTGKCLGGPCYGVGLEPLKSFVENDILFLNDDSVAEVVLKDQP